MSRAENRHHRERVIKNRIREVKQKWSTSVSRGDTTWFIKTVKGKDNPFTRCSCWMCQNAIEERAGSKRDRKKAKHLIKEELAIEEE